MILPPIHPAIVHFPIALITVSVVAEIIGYFSKSQAARTVGWWTLVAAAISGPVTIAAGYSDMWRASLAPETHELVHTHLKLGWTVVLSIVALTGWRWFLRSKPERSPRAGYVTAATFVFALTMFQGWYGGEMVYAYGAGVAPAHEGMHPPAVAQQRLAAVANALQQLPLLGHEKGHHAGGHHHSDKPSGGAHADGHHSGDAHATHDHGHGAPSPSPPPR